MNLIKLERGGVGNNPCHICGELHIPQNRCRFEALAKKISLLSEANKMIPSILSANKEATIVATQFQILLKQADKANDFLMEVLASHGEIGEIIKNEYLTKVDEWARVHLNQGTEQQTPGTENSIQSETSDNDSTKPLSGASSLLDF